MPSDVLNTDQKQGLTSIEAQRRLEQAGHNELLVEQSPAIFYIFFLQFADPLIYLLLTAATIIFFVGESLDAFIIAGILIFNGIIGTMQEKRTEKILDSLQSFLTSESIVVRDGLTRMIASRELVPGDIIHLSAGEKVPADAKILQATNFSVDESLVTGESTPVMKTEVVFSGTLVVSGQATAIVFATGKKTEFGKIHALTETINAETPLKKEMENLTHSILIFVLITCLSLFIIGLITHKPIVDLLVMLTALFICIVPEGLPVVMTLVLISGAYKMAQRHVLVKNLKAVEALGRVNVIITDKTGTLTRNEMVVSHVFVDGQDLAVSGSGYFMQGAVEHDAEHQESLHTIATVCMLLNDTTIQFDETLNKFNVKGHPTQAAAYIFAQKILSSVNQIKNNETSYDFLSKISGNSGGGDRDTLKKSELGPLASSGPGVFVENVGQDKIGSHSLETSQINMQITPIFTIPFDSAYRYKAIFYEQNQSHMVSILGAPENILALCNNRSDQVQQQLERYLSQGYRVLAVAQKKYTPQLDATFTEYQKQIASDFTFLGLLAISDEPRENLAGVMKQVHDAGIQIIMATGDHRETAAYVAKKVGIVTNDQNIITGQEFEKLNDAQAIQLLQHNFVCARFSPQDKLRLVQLFHQQHKIVATTGDGINDVPALVASDISIAMGSTGTQLTQQASDIILLQDSFANIIDAIQQGRNMFYALRRTILYFLTSNMGEVLIVFFALIMSLPLPLLPAQILWLNLITDGFLDVALAMEPGHEAKLRATTHQKGQKLLDRKIIYKMFYLALPMSLIGLVTFMSLYKTDIALARTLTLVTLAMFQWFNALNCRSETQSIFQIGLFSNFWLVIATLVVFLLQLLVLYIPFMQHIFRTVPLSFNHWLYAVGVSCSVLIIEEVRKWIVQRFFVA